MPGEYYRMALRPPPAAAVSVAPKQALASLPNFLKSFQVLYKGIGSLRNPVILTKSQSCYSWKNTPKTL